MRKPAAVTGLGVVFIGISIFLLMVGVRALRRGSASLQWPTAEGRVISSEIKPVTSGRGRMRHVAEVLYEYSVNGTKHSSKRVTIVGWQGSWDAANRIVNKYPVGKTVSVHYDPDKPEYAVLEPGRTGSSFIPLAIAAAFAFVGLFALFAGIGSLLRGR